MSRRRSIGELIQGEMFNFPGECANPTGDFANARNRDEWYHKRLHDASVARSEADQSLAIMTIASVVNFDVLTALGPSTQDAILEIREHSPEKLLAELAVRHYRRSKQR